MQLRVPRGYETKEGARKLGPSSHMHRATAWTRHRAARAGGGGRRRSSHWGEPTHQYHHRIMRP
eukprot:136315-Pyramimonas_sp.AAC.1